MSSPRVRFGFLFVLLLLPVATARCDWSVVSRETHSGKTSAVTRETLKLEESVSGETAQLQLAVFDSARATLRVIDQPTDSRRSLAAEMSANECLAGVNGGYFDPEHAAVGLLVTGGRVVQAQQKAKLLSGVVSVINGRVQIQRASAFSMKRKPDEARQCGPFLVDGGKPIPGLNNTRAARRTFVVTLAGGRAAIGYCSSVTLAQLADALAASGLPVQRALNLDGGSSSAFWFAGDDGVFSIREGKTVRDFLALVAK